MDTSRTIRDDLRRSYRRQTAAWIAIAVILSVGWLYMVFGPARASLMEFSAVRYEPQALCPGETLRYELDLHVHRVVYQIDVSTWRTTPPSIALWSESRRIVYTETEQLTIPREWTVPPMALDVGNLQPVPWSPGDYERRHAISTISRNTTPSIITVPFSIREDCP